jgi:hypothetical protein
LIFTELRGEDVSSTAKVLAAVCDSWIADIRKEVEGTFACIGIVAVEDTSVLQWGLVDNRA